MRVMSSKGLNGSRWASRCNSSIPSTGDWTCTSCHAWNYYWRQKCVKCDKGSNVARVTDQSPSAPVSQQKQRIAEVPRLERNSHIHSVPLVGSKPEPSASNVLRGGLSESHWAPQRNEKTAIATSSKVCKKLRTVPDKLPQPSVSEFSSKTADISLPYQVQHYILNLMERILEEACYDFALSWIPKKLDEMGWDCVEAVELAKWKTTLPLEIPPHAYGPHSRFDLETGLSNAVKVRNAAVHRHLCSNQTIRDMALQCQSLMSLFSDNSRYDKFKMLRSEIGKWEINSISLSDPRAKLEQALQNISEGPIDDMDWTPNPVSIEETFNEESLTDIEEFIDRMEIDQD